MVKKWSSQQLLTGPCQDGHGNVMLEANPWVAGSIPAGGTTIQISTEVIAVSFESTGGLAQ